MLRRHQKVAPTEHENGVSWASAGTEASKSCTAMIRSPRCEVALSMTPIARVSSAPGDRRAPAIERCRLFDREPPSWSELASRVAQRNAQVDLDVRRDAQQRVHAIHDLRVERRRHRPDAERTGRQHQVLDGGNDRARLTLA